MNADDEAEVVSGDSRLRLMFCTTAACRIEIEFSIQNPRNCSCALETWREKDRFGCVGVILPFLRGHSLRNIKLWFLCKIHIIIRVRTETKREYDSFSTHRATINGSNSRWLLTQCSPETTNKHDSFTIRFLFSWSTNNECIVMVCAGSRKTRKQKNYWNTAPYYITSRATRNVKRERRLCFPKAVPRQIHHQHDNLQA